MRNAGGLVRNRQVDISFYQRDTAGRRVGSREPTVIFQGAEWEAKGRRRWGQNIYDSNTNLCDRQILLAGKSEQVMVLSKSGIPTIIFFRAACSPYDKLDARCSLISDCVKN